MVEYWLHAYKPSTLAKAESEGHKQAYFYKKKSRGIEPNDNIICYLAADDHVKQKNKYRYSRFCGLLKVLTKPNWGNGRFLAETKPILVIKPPKDGLRYDNPRIWPLIQGYLGIKDGRH